MPKPQTPPVDEEKVLAAQVRVIYADTDGMGMVYHGTYPRYLEKARVEFMRAQGVRYAALEKRGYDVVSVHLCIRKVTAARLIFGYELAIEPGGRIPAVGENPEPNVQRILIGAAETRHACYHLSDRRPAGFPDDIYEIWEKAKQSPIPPAGIPA